MNSNEFDRSHFENVEYDEDVLAAHASKVNSLQKRINLEIEHEFIRLELYTATSGNLDGEIERLNDLLKLIKNFKG